MDGMLLAAALAVGALFPAYIHWVVRGRVGLARALLVAAGYGAVGWWPWALPADLQGVRFIVGMLAALAAGRMIEVAFERYPDPEMQRSFGRFFYSYINAADARWTPEEERPGVRRGGALRLLRALGKAAAFVALLAMSSAFAELHGIWALHLFWTVWASYCFITACFDIGAGLAMLSGIELSEVFDLPPLADSPRDFWSRRWSLAFRNAAHRMIFVPLRGAEHPVRAVALVFLVSAVAHEYLVVASLGTTRGEMSVFFALHGAATLLDGLIAKRRQGRALLPRPLAVSLHLLWFTASSHFFFTPFLKAFPFDRWRLW